MKEIIETYEVAGRKTRVLRHLTNEYRRSNDVFRILFARGQESDYHVDELYEAFANCDQEQIREMRHKLEDLKWQFTPPEKREQVLWEIADHAYFQNYTDLFCDFRFGGYRLLGDVICDLHDMYRQLEAKKRKGTPMMEQMMRGTVDAVDYKAQLISNCLNVIQPPTARTPTDFHEALKCAVALGKRAFVLEVLTSTADKAARAPSEKPKKRRRLFR